jgi:hypothetical protein
VAVALVIFPGLSAETITFDGVKPGTMPPFWTATSTHGGVPAQWEVIRDPRAPTRQNVLAQVSPAAAESEYPLAIYDRAQCTDGDLSVKFKITGGRHAETAGIVWRYQDQNNYYLLDFSADENRIVLYRVQDGQRRPIPILGTKPGSTGLRHEIHLNQWYVAKVTFQGSRVRVSFGNRRLFDAVDTGIQTQGKTGLWTKAGTMAEFDDYHVGPKVSFTRFELSRFFRR